MKLFGRGGKGGGGGKGYKGYGCSGGGSHFH
jgi:hypothetical protein